MLNPHTILFNIAARTMRQLTPAQEQKVYDQIECTMNGDGLYEGCSKEVILEAYYDQNRVPWKEITWLDLIDELTTTNINH
jgi:hypothetical protein